MKETPFCMFVLYLVKTSNDFYSWHHGTPGPRDTHRISLSQTCGPWMTWMPWTTKPAWRITQERVYRTPTLLIWSGAWLLHGLVYGSMSLTRQSTTGVDGCAFVWELMGDTSNTCFDNMNSLLCITVDVKTYLIVISYDSWTFMQRLHIWRSRLTVCSKNGC